MGQMISTKFRQRHGKNKMKVPIAWRRFVKVRPPNSITFRHLGLKDVERRIVNKRIPISALSSERGAPKKLYCLWLKKKIQQLSGAAHRFIRFKDQDDSEDDEFDDVYESPPITEENWDRNIHINFAVYALGISASNIFRFPYDCYNNGGAIFFVAYALITLLVVQPMVYLEMVLGQYSQKEASNFDTLHEYAKGIPLAIVFMSIVFVPYNSAVLGYSGMYIVGGFYRNPGNCNETWNKVPTCVSYNKVRRFRAPEELDGIKILHETPTERTSLISTELYFRQFILRHNWDGREEKSHDGWNPFLFIGLGLAYILAILATYQRLTSFTSRFLITISIVLPLHLSWILTSQLFRIGGLEGILDLLYLKFNIHLLLTPEFWIQVLHSVILTSGIGCGLYSRVASKNPFNNDSLYRTSWAVAMIIIFITLTSTLILFAELGALKNTFNTTYDQIYTEETGSVFAAFSGALLLFDSKVSIIVFFSACNFCGIWTEVVATENCVAQLVNFFSKTIGDFKFARPVALGIVIWAQSALALLVSKAGGLLLHSRLFDGTWSFAFVALAEVVYIVSIYGVDTLMLDIVFMLFHDAPKLFQFQLRYVCPLALFVVVVGLLYDTTAHGERKYLGIISVPNLIVFIGFVFNGVPPFLIISFAIFGMCKKRREWLFTDSSTKIHEYNLRRRDSSVIEIEDDRQILDLAGNPISHFIQTENCLRNLRTELMIIGKSRRARANWLRMVNKILIRRGLSSYQFHTIARVTKWILREFKLKNNKKEVKYIGKILKSYSLESICAVAGLNVKLGDNYAVQRARLAHILLNNLQLSELGYRYPVTTLYEKLIGKSSPVPEEDKLRMILRIKRDLGVPCLEDENKLIKILNKLEEERKKKSVFQEEPPIEFYFPYGNLPNQRQIRVVMFHGLDHSILKSTPLPRPKLIQVTVGHLLGKVELSLLNFIKDLVVKEIEQENLIKSMNVIRRSKLDVTGIRLARANRKSKSSFHNTNPIDIDNKFKLGTETNEFFLPNSEKFFEKVTESHKSDNNGIETKPLFTPLPNWYYNCDMRKFKINSTDTFFVVVKDRETFVEDIGDQSVWILPLEVPVKNRMIVGYNRPSIHDHIYNHILPFYQKVDTGKTMTSFKTKSSTFLQKKKSSVEMAVHIYRDNATTHRDELDVPSDDISDTNVRQYSEIDIHFLRKMKSDQNSILPMRKQISDSVITDIRNRVFREQNQALNPSRPLYATRSLDEMKLGRREVKEVVSEDDWLDPHVIRSRWHNPAFFLHQTKSELYSEKAMAEWLVEAKGKKKTGLNERVEFFYRHKGKRLDIEHRDGKKETSTSDTSIVQNVTNK